MSTVSQAAVAAEKRTNARYWIVVMLFIVTSFNYGDRATLSIAGSEMARDIGLNPVGMGYVFSAFSRAWQGQLTDDLTLGATRASKIKARKFDRYGGLFAGNRFGAYRGQGFGWRDGTVYKFAARASAQAVSPPSSTSVWPVM